MPIANCLIRDDLPAGVDLDGLTDAWAAESGVGGEQMTINVIAGTRQSGAAYGAMAFLHLPSLWGAEQVRALQLGLARALSRCLRLDPAEVQVVTSIVESGRVVERGEVQEW